MAIGFTYAWLRNQPPKDDKLVANFYAHRTAFERLRDMLEADQHLLRIASWGVETSEPIGVHIPPAGDFPASRYNDYLALLKEAGGTLAFGYRGEHPEMVGVGVWASGWGGDTRHISIVWADHTPPNQIPNLDEFYRSPKPRHPVFRHIDQN